MFCKEVRDIHIFLFLAMALLQPNGFHPTLKSTVTLESSYENCSFHLYFSLPPLLFADPYELAEGFRVTLWGPTSLELPLDAVGNESSSILFHVSPPLSRQLDLLIPLHARYGTLDESGYQTAEVGPLQPFLSCPREGTRDQFDDDSLANPVQSLIVACPRPSYQNKCPTYLNPLQLSCYQL
jgi:hypothetical protein